MLTDLLRRLRPREERMTDADVLPWSWSGAQTATGIRVSEEKALRITAVLACARVLGESVASIPPIVYRRDGDDGRRRERDHPVARLLRGPNPLQTAASFFEVGTIHAALWGNAYAVLTLTRGGDVERIDLLHPSRVEPVATDGGVVYVVRNPDGSTVRLTADRVVHVPGPGYDGVKGMSVIGMAREAIGLAMATEEFGARFFASGSAPSGVLTVNGRMKAESMNRLRSQWESLHGGVRNAHGVVILEEGMDWKPIGINPEDAQFLETRKFQVNEIARLFRIPPHMIGDLERATFSNIEHQSLEFVTYTLRPWLVRWEQELTRKLFRVDEQGTYYVEFLVDALLRGDIKTRYEAYAVGRNWGWLSANDVRRLENMNPVDGGDDYMVPLNMIPAGSGGQEPPPGDGADRGGPAPESRSLDVDRLRRGRRRVRDAMLPVLAQAYGRVARMEAKALRRAAKEHLGRRDAASLAGWAEEFFGQLPARIRDLVGGAYEALAQQVRAVIEAETGTPADDSTVQQFVREYVEAAAARHARISLAAVRKLLKATDDEDALLAGIEELADGWEQSRADRAARQEVVRAGEATAKLVYAAAGVAVFRWVSDGEDCPYCAELDGTIVGKDGAFAKPGDTFRGDGQRPDLQVSSTIGHPPLHDGCDCMVVPG